MMTHLLRKDPNLMITLKAIENVAKNVESGDELLSLWIAHQKKLKVTPGAIESGAGNPNIGVESIATVE